MATEETDIMEMTRVQIMNHIFKLQQEKADLKTELLKANVVAGVRMETIQLLAYQMNRNPAPSPLHVVPSDPNVQKAIAAELDQTVTHLRSNADSMEKSATTLRELADKKLAEGNKEDEGTSNPNETVPDSNPD